MLRELLAGLVSGERNVEVFGLDDFQASIAARVDRRKGGKIHIDIERQAVVAATVLDFQTEGGDLGVADVDARRAGAALGMDAMRRQKVDHPLLDGGDQFAHLDFQPGQVEQQVDHDLAGAVVGDLAATVDLDDGDADIFKDMFGLAGLAERVDRRVLDDPQFVGRFGRAAGREFLHRAPGWLVVDPAQTANFHP